MPRYTLCCVWSSDRTQLKIYMARCLLPEPQSSKPSIFQTAYYNYGIHGVLELSVIHFLSVSFITILISTWERGLRMRYNIAYLSVFQKCSKTKSIRHRQASDSTINLKSFNHNENTFNANIILISLVFYVLYLNRVCSITFGMSDLMSFSTSFR